MLKKFFLNVLSSFVGTWVALFAFLIAAIIISIGLLARFSSDTGLPGIKNNSILVIDLDGVIEEVEEPITPDYIALLNGTLEKPQALNVIIDAIDHAAENEQISAIYLKCKALSAGPATADAIRNALVKFKKSGKTIYAYSNTYALGTYYIASVADKIFLNPYGSISISGLGSSSLFMKGLFDKIGVEFQVVKVGTFKSAVEPYTSEEMSAPAKAQLDTLFSAMWRYMRQEIGQSRNNVDAKKLNSLVDNGLQFASAEFVKQAGMVDELAYERTIDGKLADLIGIDKKKLNFINATDLVGISSITSSYSEKNQIAVLYASGEIADGALTGINYEKLVPVITELADNENIKGMVLRVNSPGGSAFGSDQIGEALDYFKSKKKPLVVSMGDYAASGGYWISACADKIYADPLTITGSIGIFGLIPNCEKLLTKIGVNTQSVSTNPSAALNVPMKALTPQQLAEMQKSVEEGYDRFISRVVKGRNMKRDRVLRIAEGRVWNAMQAKKLGLVDTLGSLQNAVEWTAQKAGVFDRYVSVQYPVYEAGIWDFISQKGLNITKASSNNKGECEKYLIEIAKHLIPQNRIIARMPEFMVVKL